MMGQLIGAARRAPHRSVRCPRTPPRWRPGSGPPGRRTAPARSQPAPDGRCRSTRAGWCGAPPGPECRGVPIARSGAASAASRSRTSRPAIASTLARSNRSVAYSRTPDIPAGDPSDARCSPRLTDRSNLAVVAATGSNAVVSPGRSKPAGALFWNASITWNSGWRASERAGLSDLHQALERQVLMAVGGEIGGPHTGNQVAEARIAAGVGAQHQGVDEEADQIVERAVGAARDRAPDRDVGAGAQPGEQGREHRPAAP